MSGINNQYYYKGEQLFFGGHQFECEKCEFGIMKEKDSSTIVKGYGLFEGIEKDS